MSEEPGCPVCGRPAAEDETCAGCGWTLRTGWRLGGDADVVAAFENRLATGCRRFDLVAAARAAGYPAAGEAARLHRTAGFVRHGPPTEDDRAWALERVRAEAQAPGADDVDPAASPESVARQVAAVMSEAGARGRVAVVELDARGAVTHVFDAAGGDVGEPGDVEPEAWDAVLGQVPADPVERAFRLAGGLGRDAAAGSPGSSGTAEAIDRWVGRRTAAVAGCGVLLRLPGWPLPERVAAGFTGRTPALVVVRGSGAAVRRRPTSWQAPVEVTAWAVHGGGRPVAAGADLDGAVHVWTGGTPGGAGGREPVAVLAGMASAVDCAGRPGGHDADVLLAGGWDGDVRLRAGGRVVTLTAHAGRVNAVRLAGDLAVSLGDDGRLHRTRIDRTGAGAPEPLAPVRVGRWGCSALAVAARSGTLVAAGSDGTLRFLEPDADADGEPRGTTEGGAGVTALATTPAGRLVAAARVDGTVGVYDVVTASLRHEWRAAGTAVTAVAVTEAGAVATGTADGEVTWWPGPAPDTAPGVPLGSHRGAVRGLAVTTDGRVVSAGREDGTVRTWPLPAAGDEEESR